MKTTKHFSRTRMRSAADVEYGNAHSLIIGDREDCKLYCVYVKRTEDPIMETDFDPLPDWSLLLGGTYSLSEHNMQWDHDHIMYGSQDPLCLYRLVGRFRTQFRNNHTIVSLTFHNRDSGEWHEVARNWGDIELKLRLASGARSYHTTVAPHFIVAPIR